jgi:hypothetical protein
MVLDPALRGHEWNAMEPRGTACHAHSTESSAGGGDSYMKIEVRRVEEIKATAIHIYDWEDA